MAPFYLGELGTGLIIHSDEIEVSENLDLVLALFDRPSCASLDIPDGAISIRDYAFYNCTELTALNIPSSVTSIGAYAFYNCTKLKNIIIPSSVTSIGPGAFSGFNGTISFPGTTTDAVSQIGNSSGYWGINSSEIRCQDGIIRLN